MHGRDIVPAVHFVPLPKLSLFNGKKMNGYRKNYKMYYKKVWLSSWNKHMHA